MQRNKILCKAVMFLSLVCCVGMALALAADILSDLGLNESDARDGLLKALENGNVPIYLASKAFKAAGPTARAVLVSGALTWAKSYTQSPAFAAAYANLRESSKPSPPEVKGTVEDELRKQQAEQLKEIQEMRTQVKNMPPEMQKEMEKTINGMIAEIEKSQKDPENQRMMREMLELARAEEEKTYQSKLKEWQTEYPTDPKVLIAKRIRSFLEVSATVDFGAQLMPSGDKMRFANPEYEKKPDEWKLCYRAGKETVEAARNFAKVWLAEIGASK